MLSRIPFLSGALLLAAALTAAVPARPARILPGLQPDGETLLHNQWPIRPVGRQVALGDFPVNLAVDPSGRYAAVLHAGYTKHEIRIIDLASGRTADTTPVHETFYGIAFSADGRTLLCSGASDEVVHVFRFHRGHLAPLQDVRVAPAGDQGVVAGVVFSPDGRAVAAGLLFSSRIVCADLATGAVRWTTTLDATVAAMPRPAADAKVAPNDVQGGGGLIEQSDPLALVWDARRGRIYASLWGESAVAVLDARDGRVLARCPAGLHPNELRLGRGGRRLFVSNGGRNTVTVLDAESGRAIETLSSSFLPGDQPGATPDSLALSPDGRTLFVANAYNNNIAVFDVSVSGKSRPLGFIPTGWFPTAVRVTPNGKRLLVVSARGLEPKADSTGSPVKWPNIAGLYHGSLGIVDLPRGAKFDRALAAWAATARLCHPAPAAAPVADESSPIPARVGGASPIRYVIYIIKENRTYDQVLGDLPEGNGDPALCLFPEAVTPNAHALARDFVLLDNFYANAEVSASGHEWSMGAYAAEFVEKTWPVNYGHRGTKVPYPAEGHYAAAVPALGYLWDRAKAAGVTYRSYGEFVDNGRTPADPATVNLPALQGHIDPHYRGWDLGYHDVDRAARFLSELKRYETAGDMPRLQILRLPQDHTAGARLGNWTPTAMVADNDLALGEIVAAVSRSRFWAQTAIFVVEDDAQNGPDHVDAHRTIAFVISPYTRRHAVDSTPYTTCSMLRTMELILGLQPMSQFDDLATPMRASFRDAPDLQPYTALPARVDLNEKNTRKTKAAEISATLDFSKEDAIDDQVFNHVIWAAVRGPDSVMPVPVHAAFVRSLPAAPDDDDD